MLPRPFRWPLLAALLVVCAIPAVSAASNDAHEFQALWVESGQGVLKLNPDTGDVLLTLPSAVDADAMAIDQRHNVVWVYGKKRLHAFDSHGASLVDIGTPRNTHGGTPVGMAADGQNGHLWVAIKRDLYRFDLSGNLQDTVKLGRAIAAISFDPGNSLLWVADDQTLQALDSRGRTAKQIAVDATGPVNAIAVDSKGGGIWVARPSVLERYAESGDRTLAVASPFPDPILRVTADAKGGVWISGERSLAHINSAGSADFMFEPFAGKRIDAMVVDPLDASVWVGSGVELKHYGLDSRLLKTVTLSAHPISPDRWHCVLC